MTPSSQSESRGPFTYASTVRFSDVDHAGIVYYPVYYHYFHVAFEEFFRARMGAKSYLKLLDEDKRGFPAVHSECDYRSPLRFNDPIETTITLVRIGQSSLTLSYLVSKIKEGGERVTAAEGKVVCVHAHLTEFKSLPFTDKLRGLFLELQ